MTEENNHEGLFDDDEPTEEELKARIEEHNKVWTGTLIILSKEKQIHWYTMDDGKLGLGFIGEGVGGVGGAIGPNIGDPKEDLETTILNVCKWMLEPEQLELYGWKPPFEVIKKPGSLYPYTNEVEDMFRRRLALNLNDFDRQVLKTLFVGKYKLKSMSFGKIARKLNVKKNKVKESLEKLNGYYFVNIWYPEKEKVHIVNRGWEHLIEEGIVEDKMVILPYKRRAPGQLTKTVSVRRHVRSIPKPETMKKEV